MVHRDSLEPGASQPCLLSGAQTSAKTLTKVRSEGLNTPDVHQGLFKEKKKTIIDINIEKISVSQFLTHKQGKEKIKISTEQKHLQTSISVFTKKETNRPKLELKIAKNFTTEKDKWCAEQYCYSTD